MWNPSREYDTVVEANRRFYGDIASSYDSTETCLEKNFADKLKLDLSKIIGMLPPTRCALDACGGSGHIALQLAALDIPVILVDLSPQLLQIAKDKSKPLTRPPEFINSEIGKFLSESQRTFDLIVFSSALHHLQDIDGVLALAFDRLQPGGLLFSIYDPSRRDNHKLTTRLTLKLDYLAFKALKQTRDLPSAIKRKIARKLRSSPDLTSDNIGKIAEYHVDTGIDDLALAASVRKIGYDIVAHERYSDARYDISRKILAKIGDVTNFKLILRRPAIPR